MPPFTSPLTPLSETDLSSNLSNKNILIIGGTAGIGKALALSCLSRNAKVTIVGRRQPDASLSKATFIQKDLSSMRSAESLTKDVNLSMVDTIVFTNGIIAAPNRQVSSEGVELDLAVSFLSRLAFLRKVLEDGSLGSARPKGLLKPRVFIIGYPGVKNVATLDDFNSEKYAPFAAHMNTVVGNEAIVTHLHKEAKGAWNVYGLNPGLIHTEIRDNYLGKGSWMSWFVEGIIKNFMTSTEYYSEKALVHLVASPLYEDASTTLFDQRAKPLPPNPFLLEGENQARVIQESYKILDKALTA
ncbi:hypothetical protein HDU67_000042 [Dinochytrium kinnereticum]|nr:hypothetical protein HDU67_000042 [Dinochytrium kinnereticum]